MKYLAFYILLYLLSTGNDASIFPNFNMLGGHNLTISEAESILGEPCIQMDKQSTAENGGHQFKTSFVAKSNDKAVLYYMFESYQSKEEANKKYDEFYYGNAGLSGFEKVENLGSEAFYQRDEQNFSLLIARKDNEIVRIKVNKVTPNYSRINHKMVTEKVIQRVNN